MTAYLEIFLGGVMFGDLMAWCLETSFDGMMFGDIIWWHDVWRYDGMMFGDMLWWHGVWRQLSQMSLMSGVDSLKCLGFFWGSFIEILLLPGVSSVKVPRPSGSNHPGYSWSLFVSNYDNCEIVIVRREKTGTINIRRCPGKIQKDEIFRVWRGNE